MNKNGMQDRLVNVLYWQEAENDDRAIAEAVYKKKELDAVYGMEETGLLDDFFYYLQEIGVLELLNKMTAVLLRTVSGGKRNKNGISRIPRKGQRRE